VNFQMALLEPNATNKLVPFYAKSFID